MTFLVTLVLLAAAPAQAPQGQRAQQQPPPAQQQQQAPTGQPQQAQAQVPTTGPAMCVKRALAETGLDAHESVLLCQSARNDWPVDCFLETGRTTFLEKNDILSLCSPNLSGAVYSPYSVR
jgi:hypothetical protein